MEFDKTKVYTVANADEVKAGSKGIFADTYAFLQKKVSEEGTDKVDGSYVKELVAVKPSGFQERFCMKSDDSAFFHSVYSLFYLVEEPKEDKYRPYKDTEEMIEIFLDKGAWAYKVLNKNTVEGRKLYMHQPVEIEGHIFTCYREYTAYKMGEFLNESLPEAEVIVTLDGNNSTIEIVISDEEQQAINSKMYRLLKRMEVRVYFKRGIK